MNNLKIKIQNTGKNFPKPISYTLQEVCETVDVQVHVLRYWETEFSQLSQQKPRAGKKNYSYLYIETALRIKELLYEELYTIAGAKKKLQAETQEFPKLRLIHTFDSSLSEDQSTENNSEIDLHKNFSTNLSNSNVITLVKLRLPEKLESVLENLLEFEKEKNIDENEKKLLQELMEIYDNFLLVKSRALRIAVERGLIDPLSQ